MQATVLIIAGSDPTGGAGIQADLKVTSTINVYAGAVITCITVQNSHGIKRVEPLPAELVSEQIEAVLEDHKVTHVKIGMIGTDEIAEAICQTLDNFTGEVVIDPVLTSTTGQKLMQANSLTALKEGLLNRATVITPNLPELSAITGLNTENTEMSIRAAHTMFDTFSNLRAVVVKGGHGCNSKEVTDTLLYKTQESIKQVLSTRPFIDTQNTHGTGCTFASAYTAYHCLTDDDEHAFINSTKFVQQSLENSREKQIVNNPEGHGGMMYCSINDVESETE